MSRDYVPLRVKSNYSFLEAASHPEELMHEAARLRLPAVALADRDGVYGIVKAYSAQKELRESSGEAVPRLIVGSEVRTELAPGSITSILLLAENRDGYANLCGLISAGRMRSAKGESLVTLAEVCEHAPGIVALWIRPEADDPSAAGGRAGESALAALHEAFPDEPLPRARASLSSVGPGGFCGEEAARASLPDAP